MMYQQAQRKLLKRSFFRAGPDHRHQLSGVVPDFPTIRQWFNFRSIEIGHWVTRNEQEQAAGWFFDALSDLCQILAGRPLSFEERLLLNQQLISLRGTLALQYGTGGRPGVSAHYAPAQRAFALAKNAGPGSIAHEWFHAFDHYIASKAFTQPRQHFGSRLWMQEVPIDHPLNHLLANCYRSVLLAGPGRSSDLFRRSADIDAQLNTHYFSQPEELLARAFEAYVQDAGIKNLFLVKGTLRSHEAQLGLYPTAEERSLINQAFETYFRALCESLLGNGSPESARRPVKRATADNM